MKTVRQLGISPAPWEADIRVYSFWIDDNAGGSVCMKDCTSMNDRDIDRRNARLIAAAPELYEALREIVADNKCGLMCSLCGAADKCKLRRAVAALKKAGGAK